jgi:hypothetical protein
MTPPLHPQVETLLRRYARDLAQISPSDTLDARVGALVAASRVIRRIQVPRPRRPPRWPAAAGLAALAVMAGMFIGANLERRAERRAALTESARDATWLPADFSMWPADSVALKIPAEYSAAGKLVAIDSNSKTTGKRYWIDVVVSNDGTLRIEKVVPAEPAKNQNKGIHDGITLQTQ